MKRKANLNFQDVCWNLLKYWKDQDCVIQQPYDIEVGAGTMHPETFFRVLGHDPYRVTYIQPSRRPADGRYGENPNRLEKHTQLQVILKPSPMNIQLLYLRSLESVGIDVAMQDIKFEEDNWESPTLGAWGIGWQVLLNGLEITQFTYLQQCGGQGLDPVSVEITYGLDRLSVLLQNVDSAFDMEWGSGRSYGSIRRRQEYEFSLYNFQYADLRTCRSLFELYESEANRLLSLKESIDRIPIAQIYDFCLKCSHLFNVLDARGAIGINERVAMIGRVRSIACAVAEKYLKSLEAPVENR